MKEIEYIYEKMKDKYPLVLIKTSVEDGFSIEVDAICGESKNEKFWLYKEEENQQDFVFSVQYKNVNKNKHWHPYSKNEAMKDIENFMNGLE